MTTQRLVRRISKDDGKVSREAMFLVVDRLRGHYDMSREEIEQTLRDGTRMQTMFAYYEIEPEEVRP